MQYYLDTNILVFFLSKQFDEIDRNVQAILRDYASILHASNIAVQELLLLYRIGKFKSKFYKSEIDLINGIKKANIRIVYFNEYHLDAYASLQIEDGHKDMNDHAIIAQAISDRIPLISSDHEFGYYTGQGLDFIFNQR
ncbi:MAG TPA: toxin PIN [Porphyromonadaceae bacterium]|jgi:PIN domain nuclease of toxin-antitoxin system|uniref:type II toxin-antitoxin system VapC family toxin n=1 Tax=Limibacterium fermenti TaxID=3229863 RepID=UPI000E88A044|nr:toxin PIN [Porphyromonadaceae bacterium]HBL34828.1 toxin PIN [Porphyromonadaceae bacterium]HBX20903.1 toxin PIN [Porphyromonadaceae bacterium]HBX46383.1 toxin PIN [Porphyromonadaceae bacterium]HCM22275.1 toxin PIN [Porphyromonadaceae bacterium]